MFDGFESTDKHQSVRVSIARDEVTHLTISGGTKGRLRPSTVKRSKLPSELVVTECLWIKRSIKLAMGVQLIA